MQITSLQARVLVDLRAVTDVDHPTNPADGIGQEARVRFSADGPLPADAAVADADADVQTVAWEALRHVAVREGLVVEVVVMPGRYVIAGDPLVVTSASPGCGTARELRRAATLGPARTPHQDVGFALQQLVEIAVRGLASGSNDPYTAVSALDMSAGVLVPLWRRGEPVTALLDHRGEPVVLVSWPTVDSLVDSLFHTVRTYALDQPAVLALALRLVERLDEVASSPRVGRLVDHETAVRHALAGNSGLEPQR